MEAHPVRGGVNIEEIYFLVGKTYKYKAQTIYRPHS